MTRVRLRIAFALILFAASATPVMAASALVTFSPASVVVGPGQQTTIDVVVSSDVPIRGVQLKLRYDPKAVQIVDVAQGDFLSKWASDHGAAANLVFPFTPDNAVGETKVGAVALFGGPPGPAEGVTGSGTLLKVRLTGASGDSQKPTHLDMDSLVLADASGERVQGVESTGASIVVGPPGTTSAPVPTAVVHSVAPRPLVEAVSPQDQLLNWLRHNELWLGIIGAGLIAAAAIYMLVMRFGAHPPRARRGGS